MTRALWPAQSRDLELDTEAQAQQRYHLYVTRRRGLDDRPRQRL